MMKAKKIFQLIAILIVTIISVSFLSCGNDGDDDVVNPTPNVVNPTPNVVNPETDNSDLIGWWVTDKEPGYDGTFYYRMAIHFIDNQIVEFGSIYTAKSGEYATTINGEAYYFRGDEETKSYKRVGNVIYLNSSWTMTIVNGTIRFEYFVGETEQYKKIK